MRQLSIVDTIFGNENQTCVFTYDEFSRVTKDNCGSAWGAAYAYDLFGNLAKSTIAGSPGTSFQPTYNIANHFATIPGGTPSYDSNGNLLNDSFHQYTWDNESNPVTRCIYTVWRGLRRKQLSWFLWRQLIDLSVLFGRLCGNVAAVPLRSGRWISPYPAGLSAVDPSNPQTWNRYAYVANNPLNSTDPSGLGSCPQGWVTAPNGDGCILVTYGGVISLSCAQVPYWCQGSTSNNPPQGNGAGGAKTAPSKGLAGCVGEALGNNAGSLLLDAAGVALTVSPLGPEAKVLGAIALGAASTVVGAVEANTTSTKGVLATAGAFANIFGIQTAPLELAQEFAQFSRGAGKLLTGVGIGADLASVGLDIKSCLGEHR